MPSSEELKAEALKKEGNKLFQEGKYDAALGKYNSAIELNPKYASAWFNKGVVHSRLKQYAEAIDAFDTALNIQPGYPRAESSKQEVIKALEELTKQSQTQTTNPYTEAIFRPTICKAEYLNTLKQLKEITANIREKNVIEQVTHINNLIDFLLKYFDSNQVPYVFVKDKLNERTETGRRLRLHEIGNALLKSVHAHYKSLPPDFFQKVDSLSLTTLATAEKDIFFEDAKSILRMLFETMYYFPRDVRGKLIDALPWNDNSWYLFDFCGAIFASDDSVDNQNKQGGITVVPYGFDGNADKQKQFRFFHLALMHHTSIVKISILDLLQNDLIKLNKFFKDYLAVVNGSVPIENCKLEELPNLKSLLWYSKQLFNLQRLLCLLPTVPGNAPDKSNNQPIDHPGVQTALNTTAEVDVVEYFRKQTFKPNMSEAEKSFLFKGLNALQKSGSKVTMQDLMNAGAIQKSTPTYGMEESDANKKFKLADAVSGMDGQPITPSKRMTLASSNSYLNIKTLKGRLALLRKFQLVGEVFIPRNWGNHLKNLNFISSDMLWAIRNGLTHIEQNQYFAVTEKLESDQEQLKTLFRELQTLKEAIYEATAERQTNLPAWPQNFDTRSGFSSWNDFARQYWNKVKAFYHLESSDYSNWVPKVDLLNTDQIKTICDTVEPNYLRQVIDMLAGATPCVSVEEFEKLFKQNLDEKQKRTARKLYVKAEKKYRDLKKAFSKSEEIKKSEFNKKTEAAVKTAMATNYPTIEALGLSCWQANKEPEPTKDIIFAILKNRIQTLYDLISESEITFSDKTELQTEVFQLIQRDMALLLSISYVLGQTINLINRISNIIKIEQVHPNLEKRLSDYIALRNHLEHTDPIIESIELPYYQMYSDAPRMIAVAVGELIYDFRISILKFDITNPALLLAPSDQERTKQSHAINPASYQLADRENPAASSAASPPASESLTNPSTPYSLSGLVTLLGYLSNRSKDTDAFSSEKEDEYDFSDDEDLDDSLSFKNT